MYDIILTFQAGEEPPIIGYANQPDGQWWLLSAGGRTGWVSAAYTTQLGNCAGIGPAQVPPPPTQAPTNTPEPTQAGATATPTPPDLRLSVLEGPREVTLDGAALPAEAWSWDENSALLTIPLGARSVRERWTVDVKR